MWEDVVEPSSRAEGGGDLEAVVVAEEGGTADVYPKWT